MRWERLFGDLEAQLDEALARELDGEVADRTRREVARIRLSDRFRAAMGHPVTCHVHGAGPVAGAVVGVGPDWVLLVEPGGREALLPLGALIGVVGLGQHSAAPGHEGVVAARLGLASALRGIARDRLPVLVGLVDGSTVHGTVDRVGADFLQLAQHGAGEHRRASAVQDARTVPFAGLAVLRRS